MLVITVFSSDKVRPLSDIKSATNGLISFSSVSRFSQVIIKSSAQRTRFTIGEYNLPLILTRLYFSARTFCNPSNVILASVGEIMPPCGVPSSVGNICLLKIQPHFNHFRSIALSIGMLASSHSWLIWSKHPFMSPSRIHSGEQPFRRMLWHCITASIQRRSLRKPYERVSAVVSDTGSNAIRQSACMALSFIVGIPNGRSLPLLFLMWTLLNGFGWQPLRLSSLIACVFASGFSHVSMSTPGVLPPPLEVTLFTAKAFA